MTVTLISYIFVSFNGLWSLIQAYRPDGYVDCYDDIDGESLVDRVLIYDNGRNKGDFCKAECRNRAIRYAVIKERRCFYGSGVVQNTNRSLTECNQPCPGNTSERCGGSFPFQISLYDTWLCLTSPCKNGATCMDIDPGSYNCSCSVGWTGRVCNEKVTITTYTEPTKSTSTVEVLGSSIVTETDIILTIFPPSSTQSIVAAQQSENKLVLYIAVPVSIVVLIVFVLIVTVLIPRKGANQNEDGLQATFQNSANAATGDRDHNYDAVDRTGDNDHNYDAINRTGDKDNNYDAFDRTGDRDHNYDAINRTGYNDHNYDAINRTGDRDHNNDAVDRTGDRDHNYDAVDRTGDRDHYIDAVDRIGDRDHNYDAVDRTGDRDHNYDAVDRTGNRDHDYDAVDRTGDRDHNFDALDRTGDKDHNYDAIDKTGNKDNRFDAIDQTGGDVNRSDNRSAIHNDDSNYLNLQITA